jgi:glucose/mannose transport system substrate-binding protein
VSLSGSAPSGRGHALPCLHSPADERRFRALVKQSTVGLARYLAHVGVDPSEVDDAMQEALVVVATKLPTLPPGSERAFLFSTALRIASNVRRGVRRRERTRGELQRAPVDPRPSVDDLLDEQSSRATLEEALEGLPHDSRLVYLMSEVQELPLSRIAQRLGIPDGTAASRLRRARRIMEAWTSRFNAAAAFDRARGPVAPTILKERQRPGRPEIVSWWVRRGEADALRALLRVYDRVHPEGSAVSVAVAGPRMAQDQLRTRSTRGLPPPDTFQLAGGAELAVWTRRGSTRDRLEPLDGLFASEGWLDAFPREILDLVRHDGRLYAVPLDIHRTNVLFFHRGIFAQRGLSPPTTLEELHAVADALRADGVVPFAMGYRQSRTLREIAFENVLVALMGGAYYADLLTGRARPEETAIRAMLSQLARILDYANEDAPLLDWNDAVERVRTGGAAMTIAGDWARGYLRTTDARSVGQVESPGARGTFIFVADTFGLPRRAPNQASAVDLLKVFGSRAGQDAFNPVKGSIAARVDADLSLYDPDSRATAEAFRKSTRYPIVAGLASPALTRALDAALLQFARSRNPEVVVETLVAHHGLLAR